MYNGIMGQEERPGPGLGGEGRKDGEGRRGEDGRAKAGKEGRGGERVEGEGDGGAWGWRGGEQA